MLVMRSLIPLVKQNNVVKMQESVNARESIRVTGGNINWINPGRNERTSYTID